MAGPTSGPAPGATPGPAAGEPQAPEASLGYEEAREELVEVVRTLEQGGVTLEESLALWERGERLAQRCQEWLDGARGRLDEVLARRDDPRP